MDNILQISLVIEKLLTSDEKLHFEQKSTYVQWPPYNLDIHCPRPIGNLTYFFRADRDNIDYRIFFSRLG